VLSDKEKRRVYDAYGDEDPQPGMGGGFQRAHGFRADDISPEEIFNMFFGMNGAGMRGGFDCEY